MEALTGAVEKIFSFLGSLDYAKLFESIGNVIVKLVEWIVSLFA